MIYLKEVKVKEKGNPKEYPFSIPAINEFSSVVIRSPVLFLVGENGSGKSTFLEAIGQEAGFNISGGSKNHLYSSGAQANSLLGHHLRLSWFPKTHKGFYMRAESLFNFASYIDELAKEDPGILQRYGGRSLHAQSHGESFLTLFQSHFREGLFLLDEPEAALSPTRQLSLMQILKENGGRSQFIIATHSPILLAYPEAQIFLFDESGIQPCTYDEVPHVQLYKRFLQNPDRYLKYLFYDEEIL